MMSFRTQVIASLAVIIALITAVVSVREVWTAYAEREAFLEIRADVLADIHGTALAIPLWTFDDAGIQTILNGLLKDPVALGAAIHNRDGSVIHEVGKRGEMRTDTITVRRQIMSPERDSSDVIGHLELWVTKTQLTEYLTGKITENIASFFTISVMFFGTILFVLWHATRPLAALSETMRNLAQGKLDVTVPALDRDDEIGAVAQAVDLFKDNATNLKQIHQQLETTIHERTKDLQEKTKELKRVNAELEQFTLLASHDIQEPLRIVSSYSQLVASRYTNQLDNDGQEFLGYISEGARNMQDLIRDLLELCRMGKPNRPPQPIDLNAVMMEIRRILAQPLKECDAALTATDLPTVRGHHSQLTSIMRNLISNAIKYRLPEQPVTIHVSAIQDHNVWKISVADNGIGMEPEFIPKIFDPFERLHSSAKYEGTGIGLAICKKIIDMYGGKIEVSSTPGKGSTFVCSLPQ